MIKFLKDNFGYILGVITTPITSFIFNFILKKHKKEKN